MNISDFALFRVPIETLREMIVGRVDYKLDQYTQEERNALSFSKR